MNELYLVLSAVGAALFSLFYFALKKWDIPTKEQGGAPTDGGIILELSEVENLPAEPTYGEMLYQTAKASLGREISPLDRAPDELACCESLEEVYKRAFGSYIGGSNPILATWVLADVLEKHPDFIEVSDLKRGDIVLSPTGAGNGSVRGHVGIVGDAWIMANNSDTGLWSADYTLETWQKRYHQLGGMPVLFFRKVMI